jgi:uncharacterized repeat protein (TIGR03843 family)
MAVFDVLINNADRKGGHVLSGPGGQVYGVDHGICLHADPKLRTVLWGWAGEPIEATLLADIARLAKELEWGSIADQLAPHVTGREIAALARRAQALLDQPVMPHPESRRPIPWPAF